MLSAASNLAVRESILGVLCAKDLQGNGVIHSSDFRSAVADLGFPFGSAVVENCLVHCRLDQSGYIDFNELKEELAKERKVFNDKVKEKKPHVVTSSGTPAKPWRADVAHQEKMNAERQARAVQENRAQVHTIYSMLSHHEIDFDQAVFLLSEHQIFPTKEFKTVLNTMKLTAVPFADFIRSLTRHDASRDLSGQLVMAGGSNRKDIDMLGDSLGVARKRFAGSEASKIFSKHGGEGTDAVTALAAAAGGVMNGRTARKLHPEKSQSLTANVHAIFHTDDGPLPLMSHLQQDLVLGYEGQPADITFNSEQKLQREQVHAMLRRLDAGSVSMADFQDKLFSMGFELPEPVLAELRQAVVAGRMDIKYFVKKLDDTVFKVSALEERGSRLQVHQLKQQFLRALRANGGASSLLEIGEVFRQMDADHDNKLSFTEFRLGCQSYAPNLHFDEQDLRLIFNSFDDNGDGVLQFDEFLAGISGSLPPARVSVVAQAYKKLDRRHLGYVAMDELLSHFSAAAHPDVVSGFKTEREVTRDFVRWFSGDQNYDGTVSRAAFQHYYSCMSAMIDNDEQFAQLIKAAWALSSKAPPPPQFQILRGPTAFTAPMAKQVHGDIVTWNQEQSRREEEDGKFVKMKREVKDQRLRNNHTDVIKWDNHHGLGHKDAESAYRDEFSFDGGFSVSRRQESRKSSKTLLEWSSHTASKAPASTAVVVEDFSANLRYQNDVPLAGCATSTVASDQRPSAVKLTERSFEQRHRPKPFGVDEPTATSPLQQQRQQGIGSPSIKKKQQQQIMSLADSMKAKRSATMSLQGSLAQRNI